ncbi:hypothetical protein [Acinetobacter bereziniae]|uniref:hypothetical protein n=1 Tax=Acinetobacter bereziniae TaxID=106648 RepID=UPI0013CEF935|nr:hypothetical protein [Acinetobacter bereziniae]
MDKLEERLAESRKIIESFESIEIAEYEYLISASYDDPYWIRVKQAIEDCGAINE